MAVGNVFGYDAYMIEPDTLRNITREDAVTGFAIDLRIANYRGYLLSQIEDIRIAIDGEQMARESLTFAIHGRSYTLAEMEDAVEDRWGILDVATLTCSRLGGLSEGSHSVTVEEHIRASYIPMVAVAFATRHIEMAAPAQQSALQ